MARSQTGYALQIIIKSGRINFTLKDDIKYLLRSVKLFYTTVVNNLSIETSTYY